MRSRGPYTRPDGRKILIIIHVDGRRTTKSYSKHLLELKIGRTLVDDETCDHIDDDFTNDHPDNLQVLTRAANSRKSAIRQVKKWYEFRCPICNQETKKELRNVLGNRKKGKSGPYCSRSCARQAQLSMPR